MVTQNHKFTYYYISLWSIDIFSHSHVLPISMLRRVKLYNDFDRIRFDRFFLIPISSTNNQMTYNRLDDKETCHIDDDLNCSFLFWLYKKILSHRGNNWREHEKFPTLGSSINDVRWRDFVTTILKSTTMHDEGKHFPKLRDVIYGWHDP